MPFFTRREVLAGLAAAPLLSQTPKLKVIVTGGHPGDPEYGCGGTIARYTDLGHQVVLLYLNHGEKSCPAVDGDPGSTVRTAEAQRACGILKARAAFAGQCDGHAVVDNSRYDEFRKLLEAEQPDVVFTHWPVDQHRDHCAIATMVQDTFLRGGKKFALYYYEVGEDTFMFSPTEYVDIATTEPRKRLACYAHASQTPDRFYPEQMRISRFRGDERGYLLAEAFLPHIRSRRDLLP